MSYRKKRRTDVLPTHTRQRIRLSRTKGISQSVFPETSDATPSSAGMSAGVHLPHIRPCVKSHSIIDHDVGHSLSFPKVSSSPEHDTPSIYAMNDCALNPKPIASEQKTVREKISTKPTKVLQPDNTDSVSEAGSIETIDYCYGHKNGFHMKVESASAHRCTGSAITEVVCPTLKGIALEIVVSDFPAEPTPTSIPDSSSNKVGGREEATFLGRNFVPGPWDVICGRGKISYDHVGNRRLRVLIAIKLDRYVESSERGGKSAITDEIVQQIRETSNSIAADAAGGRFVRRVPTTQKGVHDWYSVGPIASHARVGHVIRDCLPQSLRARSKDGVLLSDRVASLRQVKEALVLSSITNLKYNHKNASASAWHE